MVEHHVQQTVPLLQAGLKLIAYETVPSCKEALAILKAADVIHFPYKFWISFSCQVNFDFIGAVSCSFFILDESAMNLTV